MSLDAINDAKDKIYSAREAPGWHPTATIASLDAGVIANAAWSFDAGQQRDGRDMPFDHRMKHRFVDRRETSEVVVGDWFAAGPSQAARRLPRVEQALDLVDHAGEFDRHHDRSIRGPL
jgi:hypothetical protein